MELLIRQGAGLARFTFPQECGFVAARGCEVTIEAVVAQVDFAANEPLGPRAIPFQHAVPWLEPMQLAGNSTPESFRILFRQLRQALVIGHALDVSVSAELGRRRKNPLLLQN